MQTAPLEKTATPAEKFGGRHEGKIFTLYG
jgi:hypothetical protein